METPELLLPHLNRALRELRSASQVLNDDHIDSSLLPVLRSLMLAEVLSDSWVLAIGGSQGAGKSTLVCTMYDIAGSGASAWLEPNTGRGEKLPVLIQEDQDTHQAQGYVKQLEKCTDGSGHYGIVDREVSVEDFRKAYSGASPHVLLPILKVPRRYLAHERQSLILLPGYEKPSEKNLSWQDLMRQALVGAAACIIVTDATRMANSEQARILQDMLENELRAAAPIVVISKTEGLFAQPDRLAELKKTAAATFKIDESMVDDRVICAGADHPEYVAQWLPQLKTALKDASMSGADARGAQLARLEQVLSKDLGKVLNTIESRVTLAITSHPSGNDDGQSALKEYLETFDAACVNLRSEYLKAVNSLLDSYSGAAGNELRQRLINNHEGIWKKISKTFTSVSVTQQELERDVRSSWETPGAVSDAHMQAIGDITRRRLGGPAPGEPRPSECRGVIQKLGYVDDSGSSLTWAQPDESTIKNLRLIFLADEQVESLRPNVRRDIEKSIRLLPTLALEYIRIASAVPELVQVDPGSLQIHPVFDANELVTNMDNKFGQFKNASSNLLKGLSLMLAVDVAEDGRVDSIPALMGAIGAGSGASSGAAAGAATVGSAVAGVVAVGFLVHVAMQEVRKHDMAVSALAQGMLQNVKDHHRKHFLEHFDDVMDRLREHLRDSLRRRYRIDERLMEHDRMTKALNDVKSLRRDILDEVTLSGKSVLWACSVGSV